MTIERQITPLMSFEEVIEMTNLPSREEEIVNYIRYVGIFNQVSLTKELGLESKPPVLSIICFICRKIGENMPQHFKKVRIWSESVSENKVRWDGNLICSIAWNIDGERLTPEAGTSLYHTFAVHKELFCGLN